MAITILAVAAQILYVPHTVKVLEIGQLYPLPHTQYISGAAETIEHHPHVSRVERRDLR